VSDIDTVLVDSLKALDSKRPIREADIYVLMSTRPTSRPDLTKHSLLVGCRWLASRHPPPRRGLVAITTKWIGAKGTVLLPLCKPVPAAKHAVKIYDNVFCPRPRARKSMTSWLDPGCCSVGNQNQPPMSSHSGTSIYDILVSAMTFASICLPSATARRCADQESRAERFSSAQSCRW
jgi:hypothetical protein